MNHKLGRAGALCALFGTLGFGLSMLLPGGRFWSYGLSLLIAWSFVALMAAFAAVAPAERKGAGYAALGFACLYAGVNSVVYFTQLTTVRLSGLTAQAAELLDFQAFGLFFAYDMLGYAFMSLSTLFAGFSFLPEGRSHRALRWLLWIHGVFSVTCVMMPMLGVFSPNMPGGDWIGIGVLEFWCLYFAPICVLSFQFFKEKKRGHTH